MKCLSCFLDAGNYVYLYNDICVTNCPVGFYEETSNNTCMFCADGCKTCFGPSLNECDVCNTSNSTDPYYKWANETTCDLSCPNGQFISLRLNHMCEYCSSNCITCVGTADNCTADGGCKTGYFFNNDTFECVRVCPDGTFGNADSGFCQDCAAGCLLCTGDTRDECTKCGVDPNNSSAIYFKHYYLTKCMTDCPDGFYEESLGYTCQKCHESCNTCNTSATDCPDCRNVTGIVYYNLNDKCLLKCPNGYYGDDGNNSCYVCHDYCSKCYSDDEFSCTACTTFNNTDYFLQFGTNTCVDVCPDGEYSNSTSHLCLICDSNCATCSEKPKNCTSCFLVNGYYVYLSGNICIQECPIGYYEDTTTRQC